ncbi:MAG TPA: hypothetical protein VJL29_14750 [Thermoguttaceae bacterium]|nr:hypothetical protein [Thermoguttaceae bacterium]
MNFPFDSFQTCLAFAPPAVYLVALAWVNLRRRPTLVSGMRDMAALALALAGLVMVGPMELCFPESAALHLLGSLVWIPLVSLYGLCVVLVLLTMRPRLVVYNISIEELRRVLADVVGQLDPEARWAGDSLSLPRLGVQLHLDAAARMRNVSLVASGPHQDYLGWQRLHRGLAEPIRKLRVARNARGLLFGVIGLGVIGLLVGLILQDPQAALQAMHEMFRV